MRSLWKLQVTLAMVLVAVLMAFSASAWAAYVSIPVTNYSFEDVSPHAPLTPGGSVTYVNGWTKTGTGGTWYTTPYYYPSGAPLGTNVAYLYNTSISQLFNTETVHAGYKYELDLYVGRSVGTTSQYTIELASVDGLGAVHSLVQTTGQATLHNFDHIVLNYTATSQYAGERLEIILSSSAAESDFDKVLLSYEAAVPNPSTILLLGSGLLGLTYPLKAQG